MAARQSLTLILVGTCRCDDRWHVPSPEMILLLLAMGLKKIIMVDPLYQVTKDADKAVMESVMQCMAEHFCKGCDEDCCDEVIAFALQQYQQQLDEFTKHDAQVNRVQFCEVEFAAMSMEEYIIQTEIDWPRTILIDFTGYYTRNELIGKYGTVIQNSHLLPMLCDCPSPEFPELLAPLMEVRQPPICSIRGTYEFLEQIGGPLNPELFSSAHQMIQSLNDMNGVHGGGCDLPVSLVVKNPSLQQMICSAIDSIIDLKPIPYIVLVEYNKYLESWYSDKLDAKNQSALTLHREHWNRTKVEFRNELRDICYIMKGLLEHGEVLPWYSQKLKFLGSIDAKDIPIYVIIMMVVLIKLDVFGPMTFSQFFTNIIDNPKYIDYISRHCVILM